MHRIGLLVVTLALGAAAGAADRTAARTPREALQAFNVLIGSWRGTGQPEGTMEQKRAGFWQEKAAWEWQFKKDDAWLKLTIDKGKHFTAGVLRYLPATDRYQLTLNTVGKDKVIFEGPLRERLLTLERQDDKQKETQRLVFTLLHDNRYLYRYEVKPDGQSLFSRRYQVGVTKEGVEFAGKSDNNPECIVSGGLGTMKVTYKGKDYYVCCTGCRDAFLEEPEKYIQEFEAKKKQQK